MALIALRTIGIASKYGASIGPGSRIAGASFELNGQTYHLEANNGANCNHSGPTGWDSFAGVGKIRKLPYTQNVMVPAGFPEISRSG